MKLKKSYGLIVIAIFLLISIGSVCASENVTDDSDMPLADDGTDVVLSDTDDNVPDETAQEPINTTVETDKDKYEFKEDSNKTFTVQVKDNNHSKINVNKTDLSVMNGNKSVNFDYTSEIITIKEALPVGNYNLTVNYLGNENYINSTKNIAVKIYGNSTIETVTSVVCDGKNIEIPVNVTDQVDYIELNKTNFNLTLVYTNETGSVVNQPIENFDLDNNTIKFTADVKLINASVIIKYANVTEAKTVDIKISTEVKADQDEFKFKSEETKNISINIIGQENQLNITKNDLKVLENGKDVAFDYNNSVITIKSLAVGVHSITIVYNGNETYATSNKTVTVKVSGNQTINPQATANLDKDKNVNITINLTDGADPVNVNIDNLTVTLFIKNGNITTNRTIPTQDITLVDNQTIRFNVEDAFESAYVDILYKAENNLTGKTTLKIDTAITADDLYKAAGQAVNFTVEVKAVDGAALNVSVSNTKIFKDGKEIQFKVNDSVITLNDKFTYGVYNLTIKYTGDNYYADCEKTIKLTVYGINATAKTNVNSTKKGKVNVTVIAGTELVNITLENLTLNVTYKNGNDTIVINITDKNYENGTLYFTLENGNFTTATLNIKYDGTETNVTLNRIYNAEIIALDIENEYKTGNFTFKLVDIDTNETIAGKTIKLTTAGNIRAGFSAKTDSNGIASFKTANLYTFDQSGSSLDMKELKVGKYVVDIEKDSSDVVASKLTTNLTITPANIKIVMTPYKEYYGANKNVTFKVTNSLGEAMPGIYLKLTIDKIDGTYYLYTNSSGIAQIAIYNQQSKNGLVGGDYKFTAKNNDTTNIKNTTTTGTVTVVKIPATISTKDVTVEYNSGTTNTITVKDNKGKAVSGMYVLVRLYITSSKYKDYLFQTNSKGQIKFSASLAVGKHKMVVSSADNRYSAKDVTKTITVKKASAKITAKKVKTYYKEGKYFTVKLTNSKTKKAIYDAKLNIKVYVSKTRYYNYNGNTGMNGQLKLSLDGLKPGSYKVEVSGNDNKNFNAKKVTSKIVIKKTTAKLTPKKLTAKKGAKKYFKVTVKNKKTKKVLKGVKIKVKVYTGKKAKTYKIKTNSKGIAKLSVKKLKVGKHKVVVTSAQKYVSAKKAKSTIKIKK